MIGHDAALKSDHKTALTHYRDAMKMAVESKAPEVFFRHYLEASLESLELTGAFEDVISYCDRAIGHYRENPPPHDLALLDLATIHQRKGVVLLKSGDTAGARLALTEARTTAGNAGGKLELTERLLDWLRRGLVVSPDRLLHEQRQLKYFSVRPDTVSKPLTSTHANTAR
jgi:hypothetical protein